MRKFLVISVIFTLILTFANSLVYASGIDMDLGSSLTSSNAETNSTSALLDTTVYGSQTPTVTTQPDSSYDATISVGSTAALSSSSLSLSNILNIILIVLGILLVLFAIAILIRMH